MQYRIICDIIDPLNNYDLTFTKSNQIKNSQKAKRHIVALKFFIICYNSSVVKHRQNRQKDFFRQMITTKNYSINIESEIKQI